MKKEAKFWKKISNTKVQCFLCSHNCVIAEGSTGICGVRKNENEKLYSQIYGSYSSMAVDPIEKKPFFHFHPDTSALSFGTVGCNFKCEHCQNYTISTADPSLGYLQEIRAEDVVDLVKHHNCQGVSWTYNEPTIWHEFAFDSSKLVKKAGFYTCYVSNGYISEDPLKELAPYLDAVNVDVKSFNNDFYKKICNARLQPVLDTCENVKKLGIHLEITYLIIPGYNDSILEIKNFCNWVVDKLGIDIPIHFTRFHPDYNMRNIPRTPMATMINIFNISKESGILYPYLGNINKGNYEDTICPKCHNAVIKRNFFKIDKSGFSNGKCKNCKNIISIITKI